MPAIQRPLLLGLLLCHRHRRLSLPTVAARPIQPPRVDTVPARRRSVRGIPARLGDLVAILAGAVLLRLISGVGFANYDTLYALAWGGGSRAA